LWVIFALLDPDQDPESGSGFTNLIDPGSNPAPDPKHSILDTSLKTSKILEHWKHQTFSENIRLFKI
jgi:hypothetical protein